MADLIWPGGAQVLRVMLHLLSAVWLAQPEIAIQPRNAKGNAVGAQHVHFRRLKCAFPNHVHFMCILCA